MPSALTKNLDRITLQTMLNCIRNMRLLTLLGAVAILVCASQTASRAQDTTTSPTPASAVSPAACSSASPTPATTQTASVEDRLASLEAYINNTDGTKTLPGAPGPGHNAWMMTSSALVLFMTLPGPGTVLRRIGPKKERAIGSRSVPWNHRSSHHPLVGVWLQPGLRQKL